MSGVQIQAWKSKSYGQVEADAMGSLKGQPGHGPQIWGWISNAHPLTGHGLGLWEAKEGEHCSLLKARSLEVLLILSKKNQKTSSHLPRTLRSSHASV